MCPFLITDVVTDVKSVVQWGQTLKTFVILYVQAGLQKMSFPLPATRLRGHKLRRHRLSGNPGLSTFWIPAFTGMTNMILDSCGACACGSRYRNDRKL